MKDICVSIICNTYNQERYIAEALESFLMQKTDFNFEVLVHDDASTDDTAKIIEKYTERYPDIIKPYYQTENQYSKENGVIYQIQSNRALGKYVAFCEGDDYWVDPKKLAKQVAFMENHPELDICSHQGLKVDQTGRRIGVVRPADKNTVFSMEQVIQGGGGFVVTNSLMLTRYCYLNPSEFFLNYPLDYFLQIMGSAKGGMGYIDEPMAAYRVNADNSWSQRMRADRRKYLAHKERVRNNLLIVDKCTDSKYTKEIQRVISESEFESLRISKCYAEAIKHPYYKQFPVLRKAKLYGLYMIDKVRKLG